MNKKISTGTALIVVLISLVVCGYVYSRIPTGMVVDPKLIKGGHGGGMGMMRNHLRPQMAPHGLPQKGAVKGKEGKKNVAKEAKAVAPENSTDKNEPAQVRVLDELLVKGRKIYDETTYLLDRCA